MKIIRTEITINASKETVWQVLMNFENYDNWNSFITSIKGEPIVSQVIEATIMNGDKPIKFTPEVLVTDENKEFRWKSKMFVKGLFDGEHYFKLEEVEGKTKFTHGEIFTGLLSGMIYKMIGDNTKKGFKAMNEGLKGFCENGLVS